MVKVTAILLTLVVCSVCGLKGKARLRHQITKETQLFGIIGGRQITAQKSPYTVALNSKAQTFLGGGVLINKQWVLTAAVTVLGQRPQDIIVRLGSDNAFTGGTEIGAFDVIPHPKYTGDWKYDLALINLNETVIQSDTRRIIKVAHSLPENGTDTVVTGYGPPTVQLEVDGRLREAIVPFATYEQCKYKYQEFQSTFTHLSFCASKEGVGPCPLDWGAPLVHKGSLIGIFSGCTDGCGSAEYPAVYADVTQFKTWIRDTIDPGKTKEI